MPWFWLLLFLLWPGWLVTPDRVQGLDEVRKARFKRQLQLIIKKRPRYVWGGASDITGLDCSHYVWLAGKRSAFPVKYQTSLGMAKGFGGWRGKEVSLREADETDLVWWTWRKRPDRPFGHVGVLIRREEGMPAVTHASGKRGVVIDDLRGVLLTDLVKVRRLAFGESGESSPGEE